MKVGDLIWCSFAECTYICVKIGSYYAHLEEIGSSYPPSIMDLSHIKALIKSNEIRIISKA